jgi:type II secretory pathway pseudopilin PulG
MPHLSPVRDKSLNGVSFLTGFTIVELLTALVVIALLVGLLIPAMSMVRRFAKETAQRHQLATIDMALMAFKNDYGDYPPSNWPDFIPPPPRFDYCGAQKLAEALLGWDLMGFHPDSDFRADGWNDAGFFVYDTNNPVFFGQRRGPYLELATANAFRLGNIPPNKPGLFNDTKILKGDTFVICDVFGVRRLTLASGETVKAGTPILYYKANTSSKNIDVFPLNDRIYDARNNQRLLELESLTKDGTLGEPHPLAVEVASDYPVFYNDRYDYGIGIGYGIRDPKVTAKPWPHRPDSYILISAGADGLYGTSDDIRNF